MLYRILTRRATATAITAARSARVAHFTSSRPSFARILCTDNVDEVCVKIFQQRGHDVSLLPTMKEDELCKVIEDYDGLVVRSATKVTPELIKRCKQMKIIGRAGVGVDNIDVAEATRKGIMVMNTPGGNTVSTAQLALSLLCSVARKIPQADANVKSGKWDSKSFSGVELSGKTLGIVGCGRIGQVVAECAKALGMRVIGFDPVLPDDVAARLDIRKVDLQHIWAESDFITLHTPLSPDTKHLVNDITIAKMKPNVRIVNCARGGIIDQQALLKGLQSGHVAGAALDVYEREPPTEADKELLSHPHLVCTPHLGASTEEAQINVARDVASQMCDAFEGLDYVGVVNVSYMAIASLSPMKPYLRLANLIGSIKAQMADSPITKITLKTWGGGDIDITSAPVRKLLLALVLQGIIGVTHPDAAPTLISAPFLAEEMGVEAIISEQAPSKCGSPYLNLISVEAEFENGSQGRIGGSVFGTDPHIVEWDEYSSRLAFSPDTQHLLTFNNLDRPGAVAGVLEVLEQARANIAALHVARQEDGRALCLMSLDGEVPKATMTQLESLEAISRVRMLTLPSVTI